MNDSEGIEFPIQATAIYKILVSLNNQDLLENNPFTVVIEREGREPIFPCARGDSKLKINQVEWAHREGKLWFLGPIETMKIKLKETSISQRTLAVIMQTADGLAKKAGFRIEWTGKESTSTSREPHKRIERVYNNFFESIDEIVNIENMSCHDFSELYFSFFDKLKEWRGTSAGFTGLSEFLVFRLVLNLLGGDFIVEDLTTDLKKFVRGDLTIKQGHGIKLKNPLVWMERNGAREQKSIEPDLAIWKKGILKTVISVKVYPLSLTAIKEETRKIVHLKYEHPDLRALLIIFGTLSKPVQDHLAEIEKGKSWIKYKALRNEQDIKIRDEVNWVIEGLP